jgi:transmembrane sensor
MTDQKWSALAKKIEPAWGPERDRSTRVGLESRAEKRRTVTRVGASLAALALVAGGAGTFLHLRAHAPANTAALAPSATPVTLASAAVEVVSVTPLSPETVLEPIPDHNGRGFELRSGGARFTAPHDAEHPFLVVARDVVVEDVGTTFTVQYLAGDRLEVAVEQGRVRVRAHGEETEIAAGARLEVPVLPATPEEPNRVQTTAPAVSSWRPLAEKGQYDEAHSALKKAGPNAVRDETGDLLLAADVARLGGYPAEAVPYLERVVRAHARDPRSGLASFTLGRVLLDELGRPGEAAEAFARARAAGGPLAEDALAREVEAASRAGDVTKSRELARQYQTLYPKGRRAKAVSRFGGLD